MLGQEISSLIKGVSEERIEESLGSLVGEKSPYSYPRALEEEAHAIALAFREAGLEVEEQEVPFEGRYYYNVIGTSSGEGASSPGLILAAHYDTVPDSPGADDNASSVAVLLEAARALSRGRLPLKFIAFTLEEYGFVGSERFVQELMDNQEPFLGAIVLECVGFTAESSGLEPIAHLIPHPFPERGDFLGVVANENSRRLLEGFREAARLFVPQFPMRDICLPGVGEGLPGARLSDHISFWDRGLPALMLTDTAFYRNPFYHTRGDRLETLDLKFIAGVTRALVAGAAAITMEG